MSQVIFLNAYSGKIKELSKSIKNLIFILICLPVTYSLEKKIIITPSTNRHYQTGCSVKVGTLFA